MQEKYDGGGDCGGCTEAEMKRRIGEEKKQSRRNARVGETVKEKRVVVSLPPRKSLLKKLHI